MMANNFQLTTYYLTWLECFGQEYRQYTENEMEKHGYL